MADVEAYVADPAAMTVSAASLLDPTYLVGRARLIDPARAGDPGTARPG
jgi:gamma-glutamyltranspeptidase/glutathione hydrolase